MKKNAKGKDLPIGRLTEVRDFLPVPDKLVMPDETVGVRALTIKSNDTARLKPGLGGAKRQSNPRNTEARF